MCSKCPFLVSGPPLASRACRHRPCGSTPTAQPCVSFRANARFRFAKEPPARRFRPCRTQALTTGLGSRRLRRRHAAARGISRLSAPRLLAACGGLGEYLRRVFPAGIRLAHISTVGVLACLLFHCISHLGGSRVFNPAPLDSLRSPLTLQGIRLCIERCAGKQNSPAQERR